LQPVEPSEVERQLSGGKLSVIAARSRISARQCLTAAMRLSLDRIFLADLRDDAA
jgi:type IV secretion system protein VirB11